MQTRSHTHEESFTATPQQLFDLLVTPSAICQWWSASNAIVIPAKQGTWSAMWGRQDDPDYIVSATLAEFDRPKRLVMDNYRYFAKSGPLPFTADFVTEFEVIDAGQETRLRVTQRGFPSAPEADDYYNACCEGWANTFAGIRSYVDPPTLDQTP